MWAISHQNTLEFLKGIPGNRQYSMKFEDLVSRPQQIMKEMCDALGLRFHPDLVQPYKDAEKKMTDGIYPDSTPMGDTKFLQYESINPDAAVSWKGAPDNPDLGDLTGEVAENLAY